MIQPSSSGLLRLTTRGFLIAKILGNFCVACVLCPAGWCGVPENIFLIEPGASFDEEVDEFFVTGSCGLMQGCCVRVAADRVVAVLAVLCGG